ncbi:hypothetical protein [Mesorhizobium sp. M6A.T.Ce.TU.016.01.1.1]|uniref:hypothetical protein n=1 Tax=Mesorhizobium sp. M6A.T.Ce.TU.016.01.1.1 TaxID=2496783 RepID=UPI001FDF1724|nr:hypothetical protein [Mesorhizobium sp. M6A.T.Ce.TU.016.01.1.1]
MAIATVSVRTMTGNFFAAASCFWQPARSKGSVAIAQARIVDAGKDKWLGVLTDGGEADDVAFLLMAPSTARAAPYGKTARTMARIIDPREKETSPRTRIGGLFKPPVNATAAGPMARRQCQLEENVK